MSELLNGLKKIVETAKDTVSKRPKSNIIHEVIIPYIEDILYSNHVIPLIF